MSDRTTAARAAVLTLAALLCGACGGSESGAPLRNAPDAAGQAGTNAQPGKAAPPGEMAPAVVPPAGNGNVLRTPDERTAAPMAPGASTRIRGRVVSLACMKQNPNATPEATAECSKQQASAGGALAVLGDDGAIYISSVGVQTGTRQLQRFAGIRVFVDGNPGAAPADISFPPYTIKGMDIRGVRKEDIDAQGPTSLPEPPKMGGSSPTKK